MRTLAMIGLFVLIGSNAFANLCYVQETTEHTFLAVIEDGPVLGEYQTLQEARAAIALARGKGWCE